MDHMGIFQKTRGLALMSSLALVFSLVAVDYAEARRGGSFGSRGARTQQAAPATNTAPAAAPVQRSMTSPGQATNAAPAAGAAGAAGAAATAGRGGLFGGGMAGNLMRGLAIGGLFGLLMGSGFGGLAGMLGLIVQIALIALVVMLVMRFFRSRNAATASANGASAHRGGNMAYQGRDPNAGRGPTGMPSGLGGRAAAAAGAAAAPRGARAQQNAVGQDVIGITGQDLETFENRLKALQDAYSREDYDALDRIATPEVVSYLAEELAQNEAKGIRNEARDVQLLQGDVAESWREGVRDYATVAMRYGLIGITRDRKTGQIVDGDEHNPVESTEVWTFVRENGGEWKLSAIQTG